jgi:hypothetical protein
VALSPDGASALYYRGVEKPDGPRSYELVVAGLEEDELAVRCVVPTTVPNDDFLVNQVRACSWSRDSKRFAVLTADAGAPRGQFRAGHASFDGAVTTLAPKTLLSTHDLAFDPQGDRAWYLETTGYERTDQAKWMLIELDLKTGATKTLKEGQDQMVIDLTVSPDGKRLAWLSVDMNQRACAMSVLDLATQAVKSGPPFQGDDYHWDGPPLQFWTADSTRLVYQGRGAERRKRPSIVTVLDAATCEARLLDPQAQYDVLGTIGAGHAMVHQRELGAGVLDLEKGAVLWVKDGGLLLDQRGARRVVAVPPGREVTIE